ncbi:FtsX-like permease family protein [Thomasclavelia saccharogumia]|uniref:FtsX-like permease family protein n=1 Tax=Thomasclavelia saccharogumia TaxID=341225 RepID=UPI00047D83A0|nr:FtsX-like permease family protein [Thomasclavelia saccharogumia]
MLFNLVLKNIRKSFKDYAIYFFTLVLGVAIFYIFNSLESQTVMLSLTKSTKDIIELMTKIISGLSVFVSFVLGFLIIYANQFLIKRRKKEFGIYMTLGMSKRQISKILLGETICIGLISLIIGLFIGIILSQVMSIIVGGMFDADMDKFVFVFSNSTCIKTIIYFGIMYLLVMLFNTIQISKCKLIDLLAADKKSEEIKLKNTFFCSLVFIFSICLLIYAYYNVTAGASNLDTTFSVLLQMLYGFIATFLIFWSLSGLLIKVVTSLKGVYFKNLNSFTLKEISSKINTTVFSTTIICLMLFVTICIFSTAFTLNNNTKNVMNELVPADIQISTNTHNSIKQELLNNKINVTEDFKEVLEFNVYQSNQLTLRDTYGNEFTDATEKYLNTSEEIVKLSDYNKLAKLYNLPTYNLKDEYVVVCNYENTEYVRNNLLQNKPDIYLNGKQYRSKFNQCQDGFLIMSSSHMNGGFYVVPDEAVENMEVSSSYLVANYNVSSKKEYDKIIVNKIPKLSDNGLLVNTRLDIYSTTIGMGAMVIFVGLYLGIVFLISSAAIIALKELSQSIDNKRKYQTLKKIGVSNKMMNKSLFRQIAVYFSFPLILAIIHSIFGIQVCRIMISSTTVSFDSLINSILITAFILILIYGGYFLVTYWCSKNIINDE